MAKKSFMPHETLRTTTTLQKAFCSFTEQSGGSVNLVWKLSEIWKDLKQTNDETKGH